VVHVICSAGNTGVVQTALINKFEEVINTREDVVHEHYSIKILVFGVSQFVEGYKGSISDLCKILDAVVKCTARALRGADRNTEANGARECVENAQKSFCLICRTILVDGDINVVVTKDGGDAEEGRKEVWNDIERIVKIDGKEIFVLSGGEVTSVAVVRCLFLTWAGDWVEITETKVKEPRFRRRGVVADEGGISLACLLYIQGIKISGALARVMR
jgi:hypothetical protein